MSIEVWGQLPKAQDGAETIEEAINRLIADHEANPTAHTGENESLAAHRAGEILDHTAGSIVPDKFSFTERDLVFTFESLDGWLTQGHVSSAPGLLRLSIFGDDVEDTFASVHTLGFRADDDYFPYDNHIQFTLSFENFYDICNIYGGFSMEDGLPVNDYSLFFKFVGTTVYVGFSTGGSVTLESVGSLSANVQHAFRIDTLRETGVARFFIDGTLVKTLDISALEDWNYNGFGFYLEKTGGTTNAQAKTININYLSFYRPIFVE